jgi:hypothetical protein
MREALLSAVSPKPSLAREDLGRTGRTLNCSMLQSFLRRVNVRRNRHHLKPKCRKDQEHRMKHAVTSGIGILAICMTGCSNSVTAKLYPVKKGALPGAAPDSGGSSARGRCAAELRDVTVTLPTGEACVGSWSSLAPQQVSITSVSGYGQIESGIQTAYATVYGTVYRTVYRSGFTVSNVPGINRGTAYARSSACPDRSG